jgi:Family of unknown function (DUF5681)
MSRGPDGRFPAGASGNPGGRSKRAHNLEAALQEAHDAPRVLEVVEKLRELALAGDVGAAKIYLDRVAGPVKANDEERIEIRAHEMLDAAIAEARAQRENQSGAAGDGGIAPVVA